MKRFIALFAAAAIALPVLADMAEAKDKKKGFPLQVRSGANGFSVQLGNARLKVRLREKRRARPAAVAAAAPRRVYAAPRDSLRPEARPAYWALPGDHSAAYGYETASLFGPGPIGAEPEVGRDIAAEVAAPEPTAGAQPYEIDTSFVEHDAREIDRIATPDGDTIKVGDQLSGGAARFSAIGSPAQLGLPPVAANEVYLRVADAAVRLESGTERVVAILALDDVVIE